MDCKTLKAIEIIRKKYKAIIFAVLTKSGQRDTAIYGSKQKDRENLSDYLSDLVGIE